MAYCLLTRTGDGKQSVCHKSLGHRRQTVESEFRGPRFRHRGSETGYPVMSFLRVLLSSFRGVENRVRATMTAIAAPVLTARKQRFAGRTLRVR